MSFPDDWDVYHTDNHWSNEGSMLRFVEEVIVPYCKATREKLKLADDQPALAIFDAFAGHLFLVRLKMWSEVNFCVHPAASHWRCVMRQGMSDQSHCWKNTLPVQI